MSDDKPFKMPPELQAGALNAWTPLQQAALYKQHQALQVEMDEQEEEQEKKEDAERKKRKIRPEGVEAGKVLDQLVCLSTKVAPGNVG